MPRPTELPDFAASQLFLRRLAYHLVRDPARAEDLVQDTWAAWVERGPRSPVAPRAWLAGVLRNRAFNAKRAEARRARHVELAGRPDPSAPETDGTLEAQAQLVAALRALDEPYRSTLVQRYYHDLTPKEIAARTGAPLDSVKSRLARGLEKLRAAMDRRYRGDRRAWCHWLTVLGAPPVAVSAPSAPGGAGSAPAVLGPGAAVLTGVGVLAIAVFAAVSRSGVLRSFEPRSKAQAEPQVPTVPGRLVESARSAREEAPPSFTPEARLDVVAPRKSAAADAPATAPVVELSVAEALSRTGFDWPQYGGRPEHDHWLERVDAIHTPRVLWFLPGCRGQPTLEGDDLYSGGAGLLRADRYSGVPKGVFLDLEETSFTLTGTLEEMAAQLDELDPRTVQVLEARLEGLFTARGELDGIAPAPVIAGDLVLARHVREGSVIAFDRRMEEERWRWEPGPEVGAPDAAHRIPLCLTDGGIVLVTFTRMLVALNADDGRELWRFPVDGALEMAPASSGKRVFLGTDRGLFFALSARTGQVLWQKEAIAFGASGPIVVGERVLVADDPDKSRAITREGMRLRVWNARSGAFLWESQLSGARRLGLSFSEDTGEVVAPTPMNVARFDITSGKRNYCPSSLGEGFFGTAIVVGSTIVGAYDRGLAVYEMCAERAQGLGYVSLRESQLRWAFQPPDDARVEDFVHAGERIYVATTLGLFCLADDPTRAPPGAGFVLEWDADEPFPWLQSDALREDE
jgi:RNA polymerase sigma-70 factor (ECF subfamily)